MNQKPSVKLLEVIRLQVIQLVNFLFSARSPYI
jgi:hypothetical protein